MVNSSYNISQTFPLNFIHNKDALLASGFFVVPNVKTYRSGDDLNLSQKEISYQPKCKHFLLLTVQVKSLLKENKEKVVIQGGVHWVSVFLTEAVWRLIHIQHMMQLPNPVVMDCSDVGPWSPAPIILPLAACVSVLEGVRIRVLIPGQCWLGSSRWSWSIRRLQVWCQAVWACWWRRRWGTAGHSSEEASPRIWRSDWIDCTDWRETGNGKKLVF